MRAGPPARGASGRARAAATASGMSSALAGFSSSTTASPEIQPDGTCFSFRPDQAMACRLLCRAACGSGGVVQSIGEELLDRRGLCQPAELLFQLGALGGGEVGLIEPPAQDAGQRACPFRMAADDP